MPPPPALAALLLLAAVPAIAGQDAPPRAADTDIVALRQDRHDRMTVPVRIGDHGPFQFMIDTGAQNTVLSIALAARLGLTPTAKATLVGVAGREVVDTVEVEQIDLGKRSYYGLLAPLRDPAQPRATGGAPMASSGSTASRTSGCWSISGAVCWQSATPRRWAAIAGSRSSLPRGAVRAS